MAHTNTLDISPKLTECLVSTEFKKANKQKGPTEDNSVPHRRGKETITGGRGREGPLWERSKGKGKGEHD